ncbi:hypothetical protein ASPACDRAFT_82130 [Aspergillus aculeatus ATCC 16872]|uniref:Myb-like domain-containing protein n=1 Tax=Aspergillus aculeatus (strain ATCC 16872 / CBS 172.66 / WB 5094) TaxID=690307 RepID=A0A1L9WGJ9_ASPA1|nr:uncharacterized protein ASPACDRAFT_82130 [Aspergillus aculeatus ATCC 16872]OJJ95292.1 hypothetical protein ASPACDRAFT_82130 [Aspergillus aculeatus ATCC 16872]
MLLPSALSCDVRRPASRSRYTPNRLFSTPPPSDDDFVPSGNGLLGTCRALQSLLHGSPAPPSRGAKSERLQSPVQIRSRKPSSRRHQGETKQTQIPASRITPQSPSSGALKRRRDAFESETEDELPTVTTPDRKTDTETTSTDEHSIRSQRFATPKRQRHLPSDLPLGLSHSDFYSLHSPPVSQSPASPAHQQHVAPAARKARASASATIHPYNPDTALPSIEETESALSTSSSFSPDLTWAEEDDQRLIGLVLEKFQLSQRNWDECAGKLGKDQASVERRWRFLLSDGHIGLRRASDRKVRRRLDESLI